MFCKTILKFRQRQNNINANNPNRDVSKISVTYQISYIMYIRGVPEFTS